MIKFGDWQSFIDKIVQDVVGNSQLDSFKKLDNDCDRTEWIKRNANVRNVRWVSDFFEKVKCASSCKCAKTAEENRIKGNEQFKKKDYKQAVQLYSQCVITAPHDGESAELALGLANRSAALFYLQQYQTCITDVDVSLAKGYPDDQKHKLIFRKAQAYTRLKQKKEAQSDTLKQEIDALSDTADETTEMQVKVTYGPNEVIPAVTKAVEMKTSEELGRHIVANQEICAGDTLIVEKPHAWILLPPYYSIHCHHCCGTIDAPYPCHQCSDVTYCSVTCQKDSWQSYHKFECLYLDLMHSIGIAHLGVRVVLVAGLTKIKDLLNTLQRLGISESTRMGFDETGTYGKSYNSVFWLLSHTENIDPLDLLQYGVTASLLNCFLEETGFYSSYLNSESAKSTSPDDSENQLCDTLSPQNPATTTGCCSSTDIQHQVGGLLLRHIGQLVCNGHAIREKLVVAESNSVDIVEEQRIATAIYPTTSMLNHSCRPNAIASFERNTLVLRAAEDIRKGEEIYNCYGPQFGKMSFEERQLILKSQYFFTCQCSGCQEGLQIDVVLKAYKCDQCQRGTWWKDGELTCLTCGHKTNPDSLLKSQERANKLFKIALVRLKKQDATGGISALEECVRLRRQVLYEHNKELAEALDALARCYAMMGEFKKSAALLAETVASTEYVYGSNSVELANELQKYAEVLYESVAPAESLKAAKRALKIIRTSFPDNHKTVKELQEMVSGLDFYETEATADATS